MAQENSVDPVIFMDADKEIDVERFSYGWELAIDQIKDAARTEALCQKGERDWSDEYLANRYLALVSSGLHVLQEFAIATRGSLQEETKYYEAWNHQSVSTFSSMKLKPKLNLDRTGIEYAATEYLKLPFRSQSLDRMLVDALIAVEIWAWLQRIAGLKYANLFILGLGIVGLALGWSFLPTPWQTGLLWVLIGIFVLVLVFQVPPVGRTKRTTDAMLSAYQTLGGSLSSVKVIQHAVSAAWENGVGWPPTLFVLLEDIDGRSSSI